MRLNGKPIDPARKYKVAGWAPVAEAARDAGGQPVWEVVETWLKAKKTIAARKPNLPKLIGVAGNKGIA
jgi:sulfur-oxidizing protein SoxB